VQLYRAEISADFADSPPGRLRSRLYTADYWDLEVKGGCPPEVGSIAADGIDQRTRCRIPKLGESGAEKDMEQHISGAGTWGLSELNSFKGRSSGDRPCQLLCDAPCLLRVQVGQAVQLGSQQCPDPAISWGVTNMTSGDPAVTTGGGWGSGNVYDGRAVGTEGEVKGALMRRGERG
jgi:hypothetical protein